MDVYEVVKKLIGPIDAVGDSSTDERRLANLKKTTELIDRLMSDVAFERLNIKHQAASLHASGKHAVCFMRDMCTALDDDLDGLEAAE